MKIESKARQSAGCITALFASLAIGSTQGQITLDGIRSGGESYSELATQATQSNWGVGNSLANIHAVQVNNTLHVHIGGRTNGNAIILFVDAKAGGNPFIPNNLITSGGEENSINNFGSSSSAGMAFEAGFEPEMAIRIYGSGGDAFVNRYNFTTGVRTYSGQANAATISDGPISGLRVNWADVPESSPGVFDHAAADDGVEIALDLTSLGVFGNQTVKFMALLVNGSSGYGSNQVLDSRVSTTADMAGGMPLLDFETEAGTQTLSIAVVGSGLNPAGDEDSDGYTNGDEGAGTTLGYVSDPLIPNYTNMNVAGTFNGFSTASAAMTQGNTASLVTQYQWTYDRHFNTPAASVEFKFTTGGSFDINWGQGAGQGVVARNGGNIAGFVGPSGIYRFFFEQGGLTQTFTRRTFTSLAEFLSAYGLTVAAADEDVDGMTNQEEFDANTDPLNSDTDGDGVSDNLDAEPLVQRRDVTFRLDMSVQISKGFYNPANSFPKLLVFGGPIDNSDPNTGGYVMDEVSPGIYAVTVSEVPGFSGTSLGGFGYKFFNSDANAPNGGYETINNNPFTNRTLTLGAPGVGQVLDIVFFSNDSTLPGYTGWAAANAGGQTADLDFDLDGVSNGVEFFMGETGSTFTANPGVVANVVSWPKSDTYTGTYGTNYVVQTSNNLSSWADILITDPNLNNGDPLQYTLPAGTGPLFVRLKVIEP